MAVGSFGALLLPLYFVTSSICSSFGRASHFDEKSFRMVLHCWWDFCSVHVLGVFLCIFRPLCKVGILSALRPP